MNVEPIEFTDEVEALLSDEELPVSDLYGLSCPELFGVSVGGRIIGIVGIEKRGDVGLLRSLVVCKSSRNIGCGQDLVAKAEVWAYENGIKSLYLLTTTAADYFLRLGYEIVPRAHAPSSIANTAQFAGLCPSSATFMYKTLIANNQVA